MQCLIPANRCLVFSCSETGAKQWPEKEFLNPLKDPLPDAPNMRIYCMYGVGAPAERSYHYQHVEDPMVHFNTSLAHVVSIPKTVQVLVS